MVWRHSGGFWDYFRVLGIQEGREVNWSFSRPQCLLRCSRILAGSPGFQALKGLRMEGSKVTGVGPRILSSVPGLLDGAILHNSRGFQGVLRLLHGYFRL